MKRIILLLTAMLLCLALACAQAEEGFTLKKGAITAIPADMTEVVIPAEVDGEPVRSLVSSALANNEEITSIVIPEGVMLVDSATIYANESLTTLTLPSTLQVVADYNVYDCNLLEAVTIPAAVQYIGSQSFAFNDELRTVTFLGKPPVLDEDTFIGLADDCVAYVPDDCLDEYTRILPEELTVMPSGSNAVVVDTILPESDLAFDTATGTITGYSGTAFAGELPASIGGVPVTTIGDAALSSLDCPLYFVRVPEGVTTIGDSAFSHSHLLGITFPSTLKAIGTSAFAWAVNCMPFWAENNGVEVIGAHAFEATDIPSIFYIPEGVREIGEMAFYNNNLAEVYFPETIQTVGDGAFGKSGYISYMAFAGGDMPEFGADVFDCQENLTDVDICWNADRAQLEAACVVFDDMGMEYCTVWRNNPAAAGVAKAVGAGGRGATYADGYLVSCEDDTADVTVFTSFDDVKVIGVGETCFEGSTTIRSFYPHHADWFTTIGPRAFVNSSLEYVELFDSVTEIGEDAFAGTKLTKVEIPASVTTVGDGAFARCAELREVVLHCDPAIIPEDAFAECTDVTVILADGQSVSAGMALQNRTGMNVVRADGTPLVIACPYPATSADDFWVDDTFARLDQYEGYERNLVLPASKGDTALSMFSGNVLERARYDGNGNVALPVLSVVVPENYDELVYSALIDLPTVEVVVIYGHFDKVANSMFSNCEALHTVIFVNGVDRVYSNAFTGCPALKTVYVGSEAVVDEDAVNNCGTMTVDQFATELPDVDAALAAVKADPITPPEPEPEPEMPAPEPITDANAATYLGSWYLQAFNMDGSIMNVADFGMTMELVLTDDGLATMVTDGERDSTVWRMENGTAYILTDYEDYSLIELYADGTIGVGSGGMTMVFGRDGAPAREVITDADADAYVGYWVNDLLGMTLTVNADGTAAMTAGGETETTTWTMNDGQAQLVLGPDASAPMVLIAGGLEIRADNVTLAFQRGDANAAPAAPEAPAAPTADASAFVGYWVSDALGMTLTVNADGTAQMTAGDEAAPTTWSMVGGQAQIELDVGFSVPMVITADGSLELRADNMTLTFQRGDANAAPVATEAPAAPAADNAFVGEWMCIWMATGGATGNDPREAYHATWTLTLNADGTGSMNLGGDDAGAWGEDEDGITRYNDMAIVVREDGRLQYGSAMSGGMIFTKDPADKWNPDTDAFVNPGEVAAAQVSQQGANELVAQGASTQAPAELADRIGLKFVAKSATSSGFTMDASMLGGEYAITFAENGDALFVMAGMDVSGLKWVADDAGFHITYFDGSDFLFVPTEAGFDFDFYGSMVLHFELP